MALAEFIYTEVLKPRPLRKLTNAILLKIIPEKVKVEPATLYLNPNDPVLSGALTLRVYEKSEIAFFKASAIAQGCNLVRKELGLPTSYIPAADPALQTDIVPKSD